MRTILAVVLLVTMVSPALGLNCITLTAKEFRQAGGPRHEHVVGCADSTDGTALAFVLDRRGRVVCHLVGVYHARNDCIAWTSPDCPVSESSCRD